MDLGEEMGGKGFLNLFFLNVFFLLFPFRNYEYTPSPSPSPHTPAPPVDFRKSSVSSISLNLLSSIENVLLRPCANYYLNPKDDLYKRHSRGYLRARPRLISFVTLADDEIQEGKENSNSNSNSSSNSTEMASQPPEPESRELEEIEAATNLKDVFDGRKCLGAAYNEDKYTVTIVGGEYSCMVIRNESDIPERLRGTQSYRQPCDNRNLVCKRYSKILVRHNETDFKECFKPTHLTCHPGRKICVCADEDVILPEVRFQFGTDEDKGQNLTHGRCLIRPTFDVMEGFDCSPGTRRITVPKGEKEPIVICGCNNENDMDKFNSENDDWWSCGKGVRNGIGTRLIIIALFTHFIIGSMKWKIN